MSFDDELSKFQELTRDVPLSKQAKKDAKKLASIPDPKPLRAPRSRGESPWKRILSWAETRAVTQYRPWGR